MKTMNRSSGWSLNRLFQLSLAFLFASLSYSALHSAETTRVYLSGRDKDHTVDWKFFCTHGQNSGKWTTLPVPSHWDMHGFGTLNYKKDIDSAVEEHGLYEHRFPSDPAWRDKRVFLVFEGVMTDTTVRLNGRSVGPTHQGGFYRFRYEVTDLIKLAGENLLEVDVAKHSANGSVNKAERTADFWVFGGIYRPVYLEIVPPQFIDRLAIDARADGRFKAEVFLNVTGEISPGLRLIGQIQTLHGTAVGTPLEFELESTAPDEPVSISTQVDDPKTWTAETPNLYRLDLQLVDNVGNSIHHCQQRFGFRTMEVRKGDGIYVNGQRVVLKGVNRHSTWPDSGRCLSEEVHRLDIETIKGMNMNAVRMSHYPPDARFLDLCDELGLYILDELAGWHWHYDTQVGRKLVEEMVTRDVNHPSILFWDNGNEGGNNVALDEVFGWYDPQRRPVLHPWGAYREMNTAHYLTYDLAEIACRGVPTHHGYGEEFQEWHDLNDPNKYIYMPTEMLHGLYDGGSGAGLADYWSLMQKSPYLGGAFLWVLFDEGIRRPDGTLDLAGNQAPDGIVGPYRQREASFYSIKQLWSPIQLQLEPANLVKIVNNYSYTNVDQCKLTWQIRGFRGPEEAEAGFLVLAEGTQPLPDVAPGSSGSLTLDLPAEASRGDALSVRVDDPEGRELWTWVWPVRETPAADYTSSGEAAALTVEDSRETLSVRVGELQLDFDTQQGTLRGIYRGGKRISLSNGPRAATGESSLQSFTHTAKEHQIVLEAKYTGALQNVQWSVRDNGWVDCKYSYRAQGPLEYCGVTFDYPEEKVLAKKWLGDGPYRVWKNRRAGVTLNVWENDYNDTITGYSGWEYPEFKGCFANVRWLQLKTVEGLITLVPHHTAGFVQVLTPSQPPQELRGMTSFSLPKCGFALLDAIPPVGSKFKSAESTGPQGQPNQGAGEYHGGVSFYFGVLERPR